VTPEQKKWIDEASYEQLLSHWRFAPVGDKLFVGECGEYYQKVMSQKRKEADHVAASKGIGWERPAKPF
jgi:hypothetical protein